MTTDTTATAAPAEWYDFSRVGPRKGGRGEVAGRRSGSAGTPGKATTSPIEPKTHRGRRTRELIIEAARQVFEDKGFLDTRIADIAAAAQVSHGTFYTYFQTKDEVFRAIMSQVAEGQYEATRVPDDVPSDPAVRIEYTIRRYLRSYHETARLSGVIEQVAILDEEFRRARLQVRAEFRDRIARGLARMQERGVADAALDPRTTAEAITSMLSNFAYVSLTLAEPYDEDEAVATLTRMWTRGIGLRPTL